MNRLPTLLWLILCAISVETTANPPTVLKLKVTSTGGDPQSRALFSGPSKVTLKPQISQRDLLRLVHRLVPGGTLADLLKFGKTVGNASVELEVESPNVVAMRVTTKNHSTYTAVGALGEDSFLRNILIRVKKEGQGTGTRLFAHQVKALTTLDGSPYRYILGSPIGLDTLRTFEKLGYVLRPGMSWKDADSIKFDLSNGSLSRRTLQKYLEAKNIQLADVHLEPVNQEAKDLFASTGAN